MNNVNCGVGLWALKLRIMVEAFSTIATQMPRVISFISAYKDENLKIVISWKAKQF